MSDDLPDRPDDLLAALHAEADDAATLARWSLLVGEALQDESADGAASATLDLDAIWNRVDDFIRSHPAPEPDLPQQSPRPSTDDVS